YETEAMKELAAAEGLSDAVIVNTCAVTAEAVRQARQRIRKLRRDNPGARVIVTGCAAQTEPETFAAMPEVDLVLGNLEKMQAPAWARLAAEARKAEAAGAPGFGAASEPIRVDDIMSATETAGHLIDGFGTRARAYVQVQNGCDHRCTFCIIPYGRGNSRSVPAGVVVEQIRRLVAKGYNEVVLTGVDLTSWGADLPGRPPLGDLVQRILRLVPDLPRLRISSIDSVEADPALVDAVASDRRLMPHLHLSLQAGDDMILKRMKRRHLRDDAIRFCEDIRKARPDIVFGADLIAGFPTETEAMFANSLKLVADCGLTWLHVFPYSPRKGTPAARMPQVAKAEIKARAARLRAVGDAAQTAWLDGRVGEVERLVMETGTRGRGEGFAEVILPRAAEPGALVEARIAGRDGAKLLAA
ncbi:MAG: tRNA (N(6)-L-threonylcarbamoyladenosine(37)-C(2))-methylthiotransferase MtaB, partial [Pseudomonadota bacterium]|nr:tRNA (N(6)-L-threonylcarbamoyladenosine(37)-C(2))-methylthiotransferase MtaB [Pseudomonadota bacterium]